MTKNFRKLMAEVEKNLKSVEEVSLLGVKEEQGCVNMDTIRSKLANATSTTV